MQVFPVGNLAVYFLSNFEIKICHLPGVKLTQKLRQQGNNFFLLWDQVFINRIRNCADPVLIVALVFKEETIKLFGAKRLVGSEGLDMVNRDIIQGTFIVTRDWVGQLDDFV